MKRLLKLLFWAAYLVAARVTFKAFFSRMDRSISHAREATLKQDIFIVRQALNEYTRDKGHGPVSLQALVDEHYLHAIPPEVRSRELDDSPVLGDPVQSPNLSGSIDSQ